MTYDALVQAARARHLSVLGGFHPTAKDKVPDHTGTLLLLGPDEPAFWPALKQSSEWLDDAPDAVDRWSARVIGDWAAELGAKALFPFGGEPYQPFFSWALRSGRIHASPILLLVHDRAGLFVSFRGALALREVIDLPPAPPKPCDSCTTQPCLTACPVGALTPEGYDVPGCKSHIASDDRAECRAKGCAARRACPVSQSFGRLPEHSAYHMQSFLGP